MDPKMPVSAEITVANYEENQKFTSLFHGERTGCVQVGPKKFCLPHKYIQSAEGIRNFKSRPQDVWICTFPRSGTTLTQEMVWLIGNNYDFQKAKKIQLSERFPFFEFNSFLHEEMRELIARENEFDPQKIKAVDKLFDASYKSLENTPSQRFIKTHLPLSLLPTDLWDSEAKVIYVARNPKDVAVSYYHLSKLWRTLGFVGDFKQFLDCFERGLVFWGPYWEHVKEGWDSKDKSNVLFLLYEDMIKDLPAAIKKVACFLGKSPTKTEVQALADHLDVKNFKFNPAVNFEHLRELGVFTNTGEPFIRTGKTGGHESLFTEELADRANKWIEENYKNTGLRFPG